MKQQLAEKTRHAEGFAAHAAVVLMVE